MINNYSFQYNYPPPAFNKNFLQKRNVFSFMMKKQDHYKQQRWIIVIIRQFHDHQPTQNKQDRYTFSWVQVEQSEALMESEF